MNGDHHHHHKPDISPLFVGLLGIMAGATIVAIFHCVVIGWCGGNSPRPTPVAPSVPRRNIRTNNINSNVNYRENTRSIITSTSTSTSTSTENSAVHLIPAYRYTGEFKEGICAVCLSEFDEGDEIRVLPECAHLFHVPCIDMWLYSHSNCPLCRAETAVPPHLHRVAPPRLHVTVMLPDSGLGHPGVV